MEKASRHPAATVKIYHGYGHKNNLTVYGHVLVSAPAARGRFTNNIWYNIIHLARLFFIKPVPGVKVHLQWRNQQFYSVTEADGFFKFEWQSTTETEAGWHPLIINVLTTEGVVTATGNGLVFIPHSTQFAFISDIDDTVLISHSATTGKRINVLFTKQPRSRKTFADVIKFYGLLSRTHTQPELPNPFFYVSGSEWNLYDDLTEFFNFNGLPEGVFLLNKIKRWYQLLKTGKTKHQDKLTRIIRIMEAFPKQRFVLLGDNSQRDMEIYAAVANQYPAKIEAVYIRNISVNKEPVTKQLMAAIQNKDIHTCLFKHTAEAVAHSQQIGLIDGDSTAK